MHFTGLVVLFAALLFYQCSSNPDSVTSRKFQNVVETDPQTPEREKKSFSLPQGFEVQLVAAEPDIGKPINMAFDAKGRLWVSQSQSYPFPDSTGSGNDRISILEDTTGDGKADIITVFADSLNIPIGLLPVHNGVIAYSIPHIYHLIDHDGDDKVDERRILIRDFGFDDTHGMVNNLRWRLDGWIDACHGFTNQSRIAGTDGDTIEMISGHTFKFQPNGSHIEITTSGRVNPFGLTYDDWGYTYSVDCHSSPIYQLIPGGDYPHFGKKPTGLGFAPALMQHEYGSTALAGISFYQQSHFPESYRQSFYLGDVVRNQIYRYPSRYEGSEIVVDTPEDFLVSSDPWFRPVDVRTGPDGAMYIADFYNRIIGHYEVALDHPGRDRQRGRIWKVVFKERPLQKNIDWSTASLQELWFGLDDADPAVRTQVMHQLQVRYSNQLQNWASGLWQQRKGTPRQRAHLLWVMYRANVLSDRILDKALAEEELIQVHVLRILSKVKAWSVKQKALVFDRLNSSSPHIQRAAAEAMANHPEYAAILLLLEKCSEAGHDDHVHYVFLQSIRDQLKHLEIREQILQAKLNHKQRSILVQVLLSIPEADAANYVLDYVQQDSLKSLTSTIAQPYQYLARNLPMERLPELVARVRTNTLDQSSFALKGFRQIKKGLEERGVQSDYLLTDWAVYLSHELLEKNQPGPQTWQILPYQDQPFRWYDWNLVQKQTPDNSNIIMLMHSGATHPYTSVLRSPVFTLPKTFSGWIFYRQPEEMNQGSLAFRLKRMANHEVLREYPLKATPEPVLEPFFWQFDNSVGQQVYLEWVDGVKSRGYPLAAGGWNAEVLRLPKQDLVQRTDQVLFAAQQAWVYRQYELVPLLKNIVRSERMDLLSRAAAAQTYVNLAPEKSVRDLDRLTSNPQMLWQLKEKLLHSAAASSSETAWKWVLAYLPQADYNLQKSLIKSLASHAEISDTLIQLAETIYFPPKLLTEPDIQALINNNIDPEGIRRFNSLTKKIGSPFVGVQDSIDRRIAIYKPDVYSRIRGETIFQTHCASCHQIGGQGGEIGPQLDGVAEWGVAALTEKILDPNRNISKAFVTYTIRLSDGTTRIGLYRRKEGQRKIFADMSGQEFSIPIQKIKGMEPNPFTLMPAQFARTISRKDFMALLAYLLENKPI